MCETVGGRKRVEWVVVGWGGRVWVMGECCVGSGFMQRLVGAREVEAR